MEEYGKLEFVIRNSDFGIIHFTGEIGGNA